MEEITLILQYFAQPLLLHFFNFDVLFLLIRCNLEHKKCLYQKSYFDIFEKSIYLDLNYKINVCMKTIQNKFHWLEMPKIKAGASRKLSKNTIKPPSLSIKHIRETEIVIGLVPNPIFQLPVPFSKFYWLKSRQWECGATFTVYGFVYHGPTDFYCLACQCHVDIKNPISERYSLTEKI